MTRPRPWESSAYTAAPSELFSGEDPLPETDGTNARYTRGPELGRGGMGTVWLVHDHWLHRDVAMKRPREGWGDVLSVRLRNEAALTARLVHPGIATLLDVGVDEEGPFYTMPVLQGATLADHLRSGALSLTEGVRALLAAARAVQFAHAQGVVHGDLKPDNLFLGRHGEVWVLDWGLAAEVGTKASGRAGTTGFRPPEQGERPVAPALDVYALGRVLEALLDATEDQPELRSVVQVATAPIDERWTDLAPFVLAATRWSDGLPVAPHTYGVGATLARWVRTHRRATLGLLFGASLVLGAATLVLQSREAAARQTRAALAEVLAVQAVSRWSEGDQRAAEELAGRALALGERPLARGVWMSRSPEPARRTTLTPAPCERPVASGKGTWLCIQDGQVTERSEDRIERDFRPGSMGGSDGPYRILGATRQAAWVQGRDFVIERWTPDGSDAEVFPVHTRARGEADLVWELDRLGRWDGETLQWDSVCAEKVEYARRVGDELAVVCRRQTVRFGRPGAWRDSHVDRFVHRIAPVGSHWVLTSWDGAVAIGTPDTDWTWRDSGVGVVADLDVLDEHRVVVLGEHGRARVHDVRGPIASVPIVDQVQDLQVHDGDVLVHGRDGLARWQVPDQAPRGFDLLAEGGVSYLASSPDGEHLLVGNGTGRQLLLDVADGSTVDVVRTGARVAQGGTFLSDGRAAVVVGGGRQVYDPATGTRTNWAGGMAKHALGHADGIFAWGWRSSAWSTEHENRVLGIDIVDALHHEGQLLAVDGDGLVSVFTPEAGYTPTALSLGEPAMLAFVGDRPIAVDGRRVRGLDPDGRVRWERTLAADATATLGRQHTLILGTRDGGLLLLDADGETVARLDGAHQRLVSALVASDDGFWSASFDGRVRRWTLTDLRSPVDETIARRRWGFTSDRR